MMLDQLSGNSRGLFNELLAEDVDRNFPAFAKAYEAPLRSYIIGRGANLSNVDGIAHDALIMMRFWLKGCHPQKIRESNLRAYFYRIVDNCVRVKQREYRKRFDSPQVQDVEQSGQGVEDLDYPADQSQRGAITTRVLVHLGFREETEHVGRPGELESIEKLLEALQCSDCARRIASIHTFMEQQIQISEKVHLYLQVEFARMALLDCSWQQRIVAIRAIGAWGGARSISTLKISLQHPHEYVRAAAAQAIMEIGIRTDLGKRLSDAIVALLVASSDRHWVVRTAALQAMRTLGRQNVGRQEFINALILALDDEECMVRIAAVRALYDLQGIQALPRLKMIARCDFEYLVRDAAQDVVNIKTA